MTVDTLAPSVQVEDPPMRRDRDGDLVPDVDPTPLPPARCAYGRPIALKDGTCCLPHDAQAWRGASRYLTRL